MNKISLILVVSLLTATFVGCAGKVSKAEEKAAPVALKPVEVKSDPDIFPLYSDVYTNGFDPANDHLYIWNGMKITALTNGNEAPEGNEYLQLKINPAVDWFGWGLHPAGSGKDLKDFQDGAMVFWIKMPKENCDIKILIKHSYTTESWLDLKDGQFGYKKDNQWHQVVIPISTWLPKVNMKSVQVYFGMAQGINVLPTPGTFYMDGIMFVKGKALEEIMAKAKE